MVHRLYLSGFSVETKSVGHKYSKRTSVSSDLTVPEVESINWSLCAHRSQSNHARSVQELEAWKPRAPATQLGPRRKIWKCHPPAPLSRSTRGLLPDPRETATENLSPRKEEPVGRCPFYHFPLHLSPGNTLTHIQEHGSIHPTRAHTQKYVLAVIQTPLHTWS